MRAVRPAARQCVHLLTQARELLRDLDDDTLRLCPPGAPSGSVGAHLRHVLDFHVCLLRGLDAGAIDYDRRRRDAGLECDAARARARVDALLATLEGVLCGAHDTPLRVRTDAADWTPSWLSRELRFLVSHTQHHFAMMALLLEPRGVKLPVGFGVAPSTLAHREACAPNTGDEACER